MGFIIGNVFGHPATDSYQYMLPEIFEDSKIFDSIFSLSSSGHQVNKDKLFLVRHL